MPSRSSGANAAANSYVRIHGTLVASYGRDISFTCMARGSGGSFKVPGYITYPLHPLHSRTLEVENFVMTPFTATGLDLGLANASAVYLQPVTITQ